MPLVLSSFETNRQKVVRLTKEAKEQGVSSGPSSGAESHVRKKLIVRRIFDEQRKYDLQNSIIDFGQDINWNGSTNLGQGEEEGGEKMRACVCVLFLLFLKIIFK